MLLSSFSLTQYTKYRVSLVVFKNFNLIFCLTDLHVAWSLSATTAHSVEIQKNKIKNVIDATALKGFCSFIVCISSYSTINYNSNIICIY